MIEPVFRKEPEERYRFVVRGVPRAFGKTQALWEMLQKVIRHLEPDHTLVLHVKYRDALDPNLVPPRARVQFSEWCREDMAYLINDNAPDLRPMIDLPGTF